MLKLDPRLSISVTMDGIIKYIAVNQLVVRFVNDHDEDAEMVINKKTNMVSLKDPESVLSLYMPEENKSRSFSTFRALGMFVENKTTYFVLVGPLGYVHNIPTTVCKVLRINVRLNSKNKSARNMEQHIPRLC